MKYFLAFIGIFYMFNLPSGAQETLATSESVSGLNEPTTPSQEIDVSTEPAAVFKAPLPPLPDGAITTSTSAKPPKIVPEKRAGKAAEPIGEDRRVSTEPGPPVSSAYPPASHSGFIMEKRESPYSTTYTAFPAKAKEERPARKQPKVKVHVAVTPGATNDQ